MRYYIFNLSLCCPFASKSMTPISDSTCWDNSGESIIRPTIRKIDLLTRWLPTPLNTPDQPEPPCLKWSCTAVQCATWYTKFMEHHDTGWSVINDLSTILYHVIYEVEINRYKSLCVVSCYVFYISVSVCFTINSHTSTLKIYVYV